MKLSCLPNAVWDSCEFTHGGKSCKTINDNYSEECKNGKNGTGKIYQKDGSCIIEVKDLKKEGAGNWTCKLSDSNQNWSEPHLFAVEVQDAPETTTTRPVSTATRPIVFSVFAFTFLIVF